MPAGYIKLKRKYGTVKAAKIWNSKMKGTGKKQSVKEDHNDNGRV